MILDLVGFISIHFQPKPSHGDPFHTNFSEDVTFQKLGVGILENGSEMDRRGSVWAENGWK